MHSATEMTVLMPNWQTTQNDYCDKEDYNEKRSQTELKWSFLTSVKFTGQCEFVAIGATRLLAGFGQALTQK